MTEPLKVRQPPYHRGSLKRALDSAGLWTKKGLSQYYLFSRKMNGRVVKACRLTPDHCVLEIGPGAGHITNILGEKAGDVYCIEKDEALRPWHEYYFADRPNVNIRYGDILKFDLAQFAAEHTGRPLVIVGNIPYQITSKIIFLLLDSEIPFERTALIMQKEVADRIVSPPGCRAYSFLSAKCQFYTTAHISFDIPRSEFFPSPNVTSSLVIFKPRADMPFSGDFAARERFFRFVDSAFRQRRKKVSNSLSSAPPLNASRDAVESALVQIGLPHDARAERLSVENFLALYRLLDR
jgi:16S rRNA (adenine1518-N6/adenine1519-N6)-dimethyltransferase